MRRGGNLPSLLVTPSITMVASVEGIIVRLVVLMIEVEQPEGVSSRKLILETARHNVITAYGGSVGLELLRRFPNVDTAVVHTELADSSFEEIVRELKKIRPDLPVIGISPVAGRQAEGADYLLSSFDPEGLLKLLAERFEASTSDDA
jgi:DNA-binding response OmpR family regulator